MDLSLELEKQYNHLKNRVLRVAHSHYFSKQDAEDLVQDVCVAILEKQLSPGEWGGEITKQLGKARTGRSRKLVRDVPLPDDQC